MTEYSLQSPCSPPGLARYFRTQFALVAGSFRPAGVVVLAIAGALSVLVVVIFAVLVGVVE